MKASLYRIKDKVRDFKARVARFFWDRSLTPAGFDIKSDIKSILLMRYDGKIGDLIINSVIIKAIHNFNPKIKIYVLTSSTAASLIKHHPFVTEVIPYENKKTPIRSLKPKFKELAIDLVIDFSEFLRFNEIELLNSVKGKYYIGYDKTDWKLFNSSVPRHGTDIHITERYKKILHLVGIPLTDFSYDIYAPESELQLADQLKLDLNRLNIFINGFTAMSSKTLSVEKIYSLSCDILESFPQAQIHFFPPADQIQSLNKAFQSTATERIYIHQSSVTILQLYGVIKKMNICISADTSTAHIACATKTPLIGLYKNINQQSSDGKMWLPLHNNCIMIYPELGPEVQNINHIDNNKVLLAISQLSTKKSQ